MSVSVVNNLSAAEISKSQPVDIFTGLPCAIDLANALKATINAHYADAGDSGEEHIAADTAISSEDAVSLVTLITLVSEMQDSYVAHDDDAILGANWVYHQAQGTERALASETNPTTLSECVSVLNDLKAKLNLHVADAVAHSNGDSSTESTDDATESFEITDSYQDISGIINVKGAKAVVFWGNYDKGTSVDMEIKALVGYDVDNVDYEFVIETVSSGKVEIQDEIIQTGTDADLKFVREFILNGAVNYMKFQCKDSADGTGQLDKAMISVRSR